jgi:hypothetical protein
VYLAAGLGEATRVEHALEAAGVDYGVEVEQVVGADGLGLRTERSAAGFWVADAALDAAEQALKEAGLTEGLVRR